MWAYILSGTNGHASNNDMNKGKISVQNDAYHKPKPKPSTQLGLGNYHVSEKPLDQTLNPTALAMSPSWSLTT